MSKGLSLHIGVNKRKFDVEMNYLSSPENNARAMADIAMLEGYSTFDLMLTEEATIENLVNKLNEIINQLEPGDTFFLSFSGHGGQQEDTPEDDEYEPDVMDEYWRLFDGRFIDDQVRDNLRRIKEGVRVIIVSASCSSGSIIELYRKRKEDFSLTNQPYDRTTHLTYIIDPRVKASIVLISSCEDGQFTADGDFYSPFTRLLLKHWDGGNFKGNYPEFVFKILYDTSDFTQRPHLSIMGKNCEALLTEKPFKLQ